MTGELLSCADFANEQESRRVLGDAGAGFLIQGERQGRRANIAAAGLWPTNGRKHWVDRRAGRGRDRAGRPVSIEHWAKNRPRQYHPRWGLFSECACAFLTAPTGKFRVISWLRAKEKPRRCGAAGLLFNVRADGGTRPASAA